MNGAQFNGAAKLLAWILPAGAVIFFVGSFLYNLGQAVQHNSDYINRMNQRLCVLEQLESRPILDVDCSRR